MNRLPRRTSRIQPPLRGRLATVLSPEQKQKYSEPVVRKRPLISKSKPKEREYIPAPKPDIQPVYSPYKDKFWLWLLGLIILMILSILIGNFFI